MVPHAPSRAPLEAAASQYAARLHARDDAPHPELSGTYH